MKQKSCVELRANQISTEVSASQGNCTQVRPAQTKSRLNLRFRFNLGVLIFAWPFGQKKKPAWKRKILFWYRWMFVSSCFLWAHVLSDFFKRRYVSSLWYKCTPFISSPNTSREVLASLRSLAVFKRRNRFNKPQSREEPGRETTRFRGFASLLALRRFTRARKIA